ncbi:MAG: hypothetical protein AAGA67_03245 [Cyanobacteria bacterium P01_F01_bin.153]
MTGAKVNLDPPLPAFWILAGVETGNSDNRLGFDEVENAVREALEEFAASVSVDDGVALGELLDLPKALVHRTNKL